MDKKLGCSYETVSKLLQIIFLLVIPFCFFDCHLKEELYFTHLYGWAKFDSVGVNGIVLTIRDINPENTNYFRFRFDTTSYASDSLPGFFEMDSVCYGTSSMQGSDIVAVLLDSIYNPGWPRQYWYLSLSGGTDTVEIDLTK